MIEISQLANNAKRIISEIAEAKTQTCERR